MQLLYSASADGAVMRWDLRAAPAAPASTPIVRHNCETCSMAIGYNDNLCAVGNADGAVTFFDLRATAAATAAGKARRLGVYADGHTDAVTDLVFHPTAHSQLASASEDGLLALYDTTVSDTSETVLAVLNAECPLQRIGFFGPGGAGIWSIDGVDSLALWHGPSAQRIAHFSTLCRNSNMRHVLDPGHFAAAISNTGLDYLVGCHYMAETDALALVAGSHQGEVAVLGVSPTRVELADGWRSGGRGSCSIVGGNAGHTAMVRAFDWRGSVSSGSAFACR